MMTFKKILIGIIFVALITSGYQIVRRSVAEQANNKVEIVADLNDFKEIANETNMTVEDTANKLKGAGVTSLAVAEQTLEGMQGNGAVEIHIGADMKNFSSTQKYALMALYMQDYMINNKIEVENATVLFIEDSATYDFLQKALYKRFSGAVHTIDSASEQFAVYYADSRIPGALNDKIQYGILINRKFDNIKTIGLGILEEDLKSAEKLGFVGIVPRIENYEGVSEKDVDDIYEMLKRYKVRTIIFNGVQVFGYDYKDKEAGMLKYIGEKFSQEGKEIVTAILEKPAETDLETVQRGIKNLSKYSNYKNTKVYSVDASQLTKISAQDMADQWGRAISQRNVRVIYLRPLTVAYKTASENFDDTLMAVKEIKGRTQYMGMTTGIAKGFRIIKQNIFIKLSIAFGTMAAAFLILVEFIKEKKYIYGLFIPGAIAVIMMYINPTLYNLQGDLINKGVALSAAILFPCLSAMYLIEAYKKYSEEKRMSLRLLVKNSVIVFITAVGIAIIGGIFVGAILSGSEYILKLDTFRGVKISFVLPILFFIFAYVIKAGVFTDKDGMPLNIKLQISKLLNTTITVKHAIAAMVIITGIAIVLLRSGNNLVTSVSSIELAMRNILEKYLIARPRTKEIITLPLLMLIVFLSNYKLKRFAFMAMIIAMIGIEDIVNSFCHIRMPVLVTTLSSGYSLLFGIITGGFMIIVAHKIIARKSKE